LPKHWLAKCFSNNSSGALAKRAIHVCLAANGGGKSLVGLV